MQSFTSLLGTDDPAPYKIFNGESENPILLICDHGGRRIPKKLGNMGIEEKELQRHIAWDIGAQDIGICMSQILDAPLICGVYSRLVVDLNRYPWAEGAIPEISDHVAIPANQHLSDPERQRRIDEIHRPYHDAIQRHCDKVLARQQQPIVISIHTMTDQLFGGEVRDEAYAVLWDQCDDKLAKDLLAWLSTNSPLKVGDNTPYAMDIGIDFSIPEHCYRRHIPSLMFEVRQDLVDSQETAENHGALWARGIQEVLNIKGYLRKKA